MLIHGIFSAKEHASATFQAHATYRFADHPLVLFDNFCHRLWLAQQISHGSVRSE